MKLIRSTQFFMLSASAVSSLLGVPVVEPLALRHAVELALARRPQVRDPRVQLPLERLAVVPAVVVSANGITIQLVSFISDSR